MNSKKYEVNGSSNSKPVELKPRTLSSHSLSTSPSVLYLANLDSGSPQVTIQTDIDSEARQSSNQQPVVVQTIFDGISKSSDNLASGQEYRRNLSDNSNQQSNNINLSPSISLHRNFSEDQSQGQSSSPNTTSPTKKSPSGLSSLTKLHQKIFKKAETRSDILPTNTTAENMPSNYTKQISHNCNHKKSPTFISHLNEVDPSAYLPGVNVLMPFSQIFGAQRAMSHSVSVDHDRSIDASIPLSTRLELNRKLKLLSPEDRIEIQQISYLKMKERLKLKTDLRDNLKMDIRELNDKLVGQNTMIRSQLENEKLRGEIRDLTNEKARLEMKFNQQSNWICQKCTYSNLYDCSKCNICEADREDILICVHCGQKNSLSELSCIKCNAYFNVESTMSAITPTEINQNPFLQDQQSVMSRQGSSASGSPNDLPAYGVIGGDPMIPFIPDK